MSSIHKTAQKYDRRADNSQHPFISVITSTYCAAKHFPKTAASIRAQDFDDFEWIVIDGASTDGTVDVLRQNEDIIDCWLSEPDSGIYDAWNKGVREAKGQWIMFLGADDQLLTLDVLAQAALVLRKVASDIRVVYGNMALIGPTGDELYRVGEPWDAIRRRFSSVMCLPHPATFHHRDLFQLYGGFDASFRIAGDYEFLRRELPLHDATYVPDLVVTGMSVGGISSNPETTRKTLLETHRATRKNGRVFPGWPWVMAFGRYLLRQALWRLCGEKATRRLLDIGRRIMGKSAHWTRT